MKEIVKYQCESCLRDYSNEKFITTCEDCGKEVCYECGYQIDDNIYCFKCYMRNMDDYN